MECTGSELTSNLGNMLFYLGLFPTFDQLSDKITTEIEETAVKNREAMNQLKRNEVNEETGELPDDSKPEEEEGGSPKGVPADDDGASEMISSQKGRMFQL
jgi:hypothetical protein